MNNPLPITKSPEARRLQEIWKKLNDNEVLRRIPSRINPNIVFSEDEDEDDDINPPGYSSDSENTVVNRYSESKLLTPDLVFKSRSDIQLHRSARRKRQPLRDIITPRCSTRNDTTVSTEVSVDQRDEISDCINRMYADTLEGSSHFQKGAMQKEDNSSTANAKADQKVTKKVEFSSKSTEEKLEPEKDMFVNGNCFSILTELGVGGSCKVYSAYNKQTRKLVAIKCVDLQNDKHGMNESYLKEIEYLKMLSGSQHVIQMHDYSYNPKSLIIVLEKGDIDLSHYLSNELKTKKLSSIEIKYYWFQMLTAVFEIHSCGIIHSDLKPANFLFVCGRLKLIDFGIASSVPEDKTSVLRDNQIGTVNYISPEAISCLPATDSSNKYVYKLNFKCDVWSLGCILYDMVYGYTPFAGLPTVFCKIQAILNPLFEIPYPQTCDQEVIDIMKICLVRNPRERASVEDLLMHPYLCVKPNDNPAEQSKIAELVTQLRKLTPRRLGAVSDVVQKLSELK